MTYTNEFKTKCFNTLRFCQTVDINHLMKALEEGNDTLVRYSLEAALDDEDLYDQSKVTDDGELIVLNAKLHAFSKRRELYSEFMERYTQVLDGEPIVASISASR